MKKITLLRLVLTFSLIISVAYINASQKAPDFSGRTLNGTLFALKDNLNNGPIIINFWATWCVPCMQEMDELKKIVSSDEFKDKKIQVVSVSIDDPQSQGSVITTVKSRQWPFTVLLDPSKQIYNQFKVTNVPQMVIINSNGEIIYQHSAFKKGDEKHIIEILKNL